MSSRHALQQAPQLPALQETLGVLPSYYADACTTIVMKGKWKSWSGNDHSVKTVEGIPILKIQGVPLSMSSRCEVTNIEDQLLFTVRKELFSFIPSFYAEDPKGNRFLDVSGEFSFRKTKSTVTFTNAADGKETTLKMKGNFLDRMMEIKLGDSDTVVARIDRQMFSGWSMFGGPQTYFVTIAPNMDMALVVAMCLCMDERRRSKGD